MESDPMPSHPAALRASAFSRKREKGIRPLARLRVACGRGVG